MNVFKILGVIVFLITSGYSDILGQSISGPATAQAQAAVSYTFTDDTVFPNPSWTIANGTITSQTQSGLTYTANVKFTCDGTGTIAFKNGSATLSTKNVTVSCPLVRAPTTTFSYSSACGSTTITHTSTPGLGTTLFWQTSPTGTQTDLGTATSITVTSNGTYYLRPRSNTANCCWGTAVATAPITITTAQTPTPSNGSRCGSGSVSLSATAGAGGTTVRWYAASTGGSVLAEALTYNTTSLSTTTTYYISTYTASPVCESARIPITATVNAEPAIPATASSTPVSVCNSGTISLSATGLQAGEVYTWYNVPTGGTALGSTTPTINATSTFYVAKKNSTTGCEGPRLSVSIPVNPIPVVTITGTDHLAYGGSTGLSTSTSSYSYQWAKNGVDIPGATLVNCTVNEPATYTVKVKANASSQQCVSSVTEIRSTLSDSPAAVNWVSTTLILKEGFAPTATVHSLLPSEVAQVIQYQDGLGRTFQTNGVGLSPNQGDIVSPSIYGVQGIPDTTYLPYVTSTRDGRIRLSAVRASGTFLYSGSEQYLFYQNAANVEHDTYPYAVSKYNNAPDFRVNEQGAPGADWQLGAHTSKNSITHNVANQVRYWKPDGTTNSYYNLRELLVVKSTDENGHIVNVFKDKLGRTILKQVQLDELIDNIMVPYLETYYIYDNYNQLTYEIPPKAISILGNGASLDVNNSSIAEFIFKYTYDKKGRLTEKKVPNAVAQYMVYDKLDRLVLSQDGNLRAQNKWLFMKYDAFDRIVYSGIYLNSTETTRPAVQALFDARNYDSEPYFDIEEINTTYQGYSNRVFPSIGLTVLAVNYYDHYNFDRTADGSADYSYDAAHFSGQNSAASTNVRNMATGSKRVTINEAGTLSSTWLTSVVFYDKYYRVIQTQSNNHLYATVADKNTVIYTNLGGTVKKSKTTHYSSVSSFINLFDRTDYDHAGRPLKVYRQINSDPEKLLVQYQYNELGQLIDKKLHDTGSGSFLQSIDYRYNIRGWLRSINGSQLAVTPDNDDSNDYFGMDIVYNTTDAGLGNTAYYNGNISALKWKSLGDAAGAIGQRGYKYAYDKSDKLETATFQMHDGTAWTKEVGTLDEIMSYDANGNIISLKRNQNLRSFAIQNGLPKVISSPELIDNLTYTYTTATANRVTKVEDAVAVGLVGDKGFKNGANTSTEYSYAADGNMTGDSNKGISSITYNILGKPASVVLSGGKSVAYTYDAMGTKLKMVVTDGSVTTTDYVGGFVYTNSSLSFFSSPEGRVVKNGSIFEYQYAVTDHQGNTRVLFSSVTPIAEAPASSNLETSGGFGNYNNVSSMEVFDHTDAGTVNQKSQKLTGAPSAMVGLSKSYKVFPGDKVKADVWAKYWHPNSNPSSLPDFAAMLTSAFGVSSSSTGEALKAFNALNNFGGLVSAGTAHGNNTGEPKAFVTIVLFDKNYKLVDAAWDQIDDSYVQSDDGIKQAFDFLTKEVTVKEEGYAYVYLSNESPTGIDVYFDDIAVTYTPSNIIQYNEYYPFGLQTDNSWTRSGSDNDYLYNSGSELNSITNNYEMFFRGYDPALARMFQVDPLASSYSSLSPYNYAANDPVVFNDPNGDRLSVSQIMYERNHNLPWERAEYAFLGGFHSLENYGGEDWRSATYGPSYFKDANAVRNGTMSLEEYARRHGTTYELNIIDYYTYGIQDQEHYINSEYFFSETNGEGPWFTDKQGEILGMHWLEGSGKSLFLTDKSWQDYMEANSVIGGTIAGIIHDDATTRTASGVVVKRISIELAENDRRSGYGMLHGTLNFDYAFKATVLSSKQIEYTCTFWWNDRIDPSARQGDNPFVVAAKLYYNPADYDVTVKWNQTYLINR